jgi:lysophospholipase L1-like esterase
MRWVSLGLTALFGAGLAACANRTPDPPDQVVYLAIGARYAAGMGAEPLTKGYVFQIADELDQRIDKVSLVPLAIPGADTAELDSGLERLLQTEIAPDLVTVWTGANDVIRGEQVDAFETALEQMFERLDDRTEAVIVAANVPDLTALRRFRNNPDPDVTRERIEAFNQVIAEQAEDNDVLLVDLYAEPVVDDLVSDQEEGFQVNKEGHSRIAEKFLEVILPALGLAPTV